MMEELKNAKPDDWFQTRDHGVAKYIKTEYVTIAVHHMMLESGTRFSVDQNGHLFQTTAQTYFDVVGKV
jgi:hypothetical protein